MRWEKEQEIEVMLKVWICVFLLFMFLRLFA